MPKTEKIKLSPAERSQAVKDGWAKRREGANAQPANLVETITSVTLEYCTEPLSHKEPVIHTELRPAPPIVEQEPVIQEPAPIPQLAPVVPKKPKRYIGPKEFSSALKAAEKRLALAIMERAKAAGQLAALQAEIPSLLQIIAALKGQHVSPAPPYDFSGSVPNAQAFQSPIPQYQNPLDLIQGAVPAPPISRAHGGAMQFSPDIVGTLEGPDDDDRFITGPGSEEKGWIGN